MKKGFNLLRELFLSENRTKADQKIERLLKEKAYGAPFLLDDLLYHVNPTKITNPILEHSKRFRVYLCLLFAEERGFSVDDILPLAVAIELLHSSTLIIDDVQDGDYIRCGKEALWRKVGISRAFHAATFLSTLFHTYLAQKTTEKRFYNYSQIVSEIIKDLFNGQQLDVSGKIKTIEEYEKMAQGKTGALILLSTTFGSMPYEFNEKNFQLLQEFSKNFACYYQVRDDIMDIKSKEKLDTGNILNIVFSGDVGKLDEVYKIMHSYEQKSRENIEEMKSLGLIKTDKLNWVLDSFLLKTGK